MHLLTSAGLQYQLFNPHGHHACDVIAHNYHYYSKQILHLAERPLIKGFSKKTKNHHIFNITFRSSFIYVYDCTQFFFSSSSSKKQNPSAFYRFRAPPVKPFFFFFVFFFFCFFFFLHAINYIIYLWRIGIYK